MPGPRISIITAVFNARETIGDALDSVRSQSYPDVEYIVINGASDDGTSELLTARREQINVYVNEPDSGIYDALNKGIALATGDVIGFLHADDLFADPKVLELVAREFADESVDAVYGDLVYVSKDEPDKQIRYWRAGDYSPDRLRRGWMPPHPTLYLRRSVYERMGAFDTSFHIAADYDCMLRVLDSGKINCRYIPEVLVRMRMGGKSNRSFVNIMHKSFEDYRALKKNHMGGLYALFCKNMSKLPQFFLREGPRQQE
jgi:glycosyltransferase involved in cell wall biosynthesis